MDRPNSQILRCDLIYFLLCYFPADEVVMLFHVEQIARFFRHGTQNPKFLEISRKCLKPLSSRAFTGNLMSFCLSLAARYDDTVAFFRPFATWSESGMA
jgi:hypothetical protein